ncbi:lysogenization regulator [Candidatus Rickettsiella isopodorum]|jgi:high frequency lysogenization protein|uniref:High frequency lysogenization protein HflD homolog n=1 Tax=Candidatus Rickettsiella isopodorum TaxID=1225476 RepID=A0A1J8PK60_9COXI|nr:high frequency lysogenization protein HflD [Candidatus Rickettsiella isopodorum]MCH9636542.1 high frequency lysogenization protein HflD [Gammaproteobacteria bacterium]MDQ5900243.1 High frequency lysogenization protein HflD [Pseudomonadota bacterium]MCH9754288.1 high frequency lysogenization protein HflD [Gammaproteobacteria bacterium]MDD4892721.1 high frequency lysogenization protein HflD [Candidatus Rickettsiella isopodorum]MDD5162323.1 high frequency lysogenization protein HflD [Candidatu
MHNNEKKNVERSLALAGVFQSAALVRDLARTGKTEKLAFDTSIQSIYTIDVNTVEQVYGGTIDGLRLGLQELVNLLAYTKIKQDRELTRYLIGLIHLERKLLRSPETKTNLSRRIKHAISQANYFASSPQLIINSLADIYVTTLGSLPFRLHVVGQSKYLTHAETVSKIRAALLAGVRSAVLWRQLGGSRWQFFLMRHTLIGIGKKLLTRLNSK